MKNQSNYTAAGSKFEISINDSPSHTVCPDTDES